MMKILLSAIFVASCLNSVCAEPVKSEFARQDGPRRGSTEFVRYDGPQPRFKINLAARADRSFAVPVYFTYPEREYHVLGFIQEHGSHSENSAALRSMAVAAKLHGADAIVMRPLTDQMRKAMQGDQPAMFAHAVAVKWGPAPL